MAKKGGPSIKGMHIAFGIGSALLMITTVWVFVQDHFGREFPKYQSKYDQLELQRLQDQKQQIEEQLASADLSAEVEELQGKVQDAQKDLDAQQDKIKQEKAEVQKIDDQLAYAMRVLNFDRAEMDEIKYKADEKIGGVTLDHVNKQQEKIALQFAKVEDLKVQKAEKLTALAQIEKDYKEAPA